MEVKPNIYYVWQMSLLTVIVITFSSIHTSKSQAYTAIWLMLRGERQSHTETSLGIFLEEVTRF